MLDQAHARGFVAALIFVVPTIAIGCSSSDSNNPVPDASTSSPQDGGGTDSAKADGGGTDSGAAPSQCGHPGDKGNSLGVGQYCASLSDCTGKAKLCSSLGNDPSQPMNDTFFCTIFPCHADGGPDECGEDATCVCGSAQGMTGCACTPNTCLSSDGGADAATDAGTDAPADATTDATTDAASEAATDAGSDANGGD